MKSENLMRRVMAVLRSRTLIKSQREKITSALLIQETLKTTKIKIITIALSVGTIFHKRGGYRLKKAHLDDLVDIYDCDKNLRMLK